MGSRPRPVTAPLSRYPPSLSLSLALSPANPTREPLSDPAPRDDDEDDDGLDLVRLRAVEEDESL